MSRILVGTSSWTDKTLVDSGRFYPATATTPEERLRFYASRFPIVEIDSSYYGIPTVESSAALGRAHARRIRLQHQDVPAVHAPPDAGREPREGYSRSTRAGAEQECLRQGRSRGNINAAVAAIPCRAGGAARMAKGSAPCTCSSRRGWRFIPKASRTSSIAERCWQASPWPSSSGTRRGSTRPGTQTARCISSATTRWSTSSSMRRRASRTPFRPCGEVTNPALAIVRLHGRNHATWNQKGLKASSQRFDYDYNDAELTEIGAQVKVLADSVQSTHVLFNNNYQDRGPAWRGGVARDSRDGRFNQ